MNYCTTKRIHMPDTDHELFVCQCSSMEHIFILSVHEWNHEKEPEPKPEDNVDCYIHIHLSTYKGFFGRLWEAIKHVFGYKCKYGHFDCIMLDESKADKLIAGLNKYKAILTHYKQKGK